MELLSSNRLEKKGEIVFLQGSCDTYKMAAQEITTPLATPERSADVLGVSKARTAKLIRWARESASRSLLEKPGSSSARTNGKAALRKTASK
jgi:hypothetical protein